MTAPLFYTVVAHYPSLGVEREESRHETLRDARDAARALSIRHPGVRVSVRSVTIRRAAEIN